MSFIIILLCLSAQWFLHIPVPRDFPWEEKYLAWMRKRFISLTHEHRLFSFLLLVLPIVIVMSLIFTLTYHFLGAIGYRLLSLVLLLFCVDTIFLKQAHTTQMSTATLFLKSYQKIFAPLAWYFIAGPIGLTLYVVVETLRAQLSTQKYFILVAGILDWVPVRLAGLTFALAGNFGAVFKDWMKELFRGVAHQQDQVIVWGEIAVVSEKKDAITVNDAITLVQRSVLIWVILFGLIALGRWIE